MLVQINLCLETLFSINRKHTIELCKEIISQNLKIEYLIETHLKKFR